MAKDPAYLFYPADFEMGTIGWNFEQKGKYITLLNIQHSKGGYLSKKDLDRILSSNDDDNEVRTKFVEENGKYYNQRLLDEINKRKKQSEKQRDNSLKRWNKKSNAMAMPTQCDGNAMGMPLENRNRNINTNDLNNLKEEKEDSVKEEKEENFKKNIDYQKIVDYWNSKEKLQKIEVLTNGRKSTINARFKEHGIEKIFKMIDNAEISPFLIEKGFANFNWCFRPENFPKVLEGNYLNGSKKSKNQKPDYDIDWLDDYYNSI